nr:MAG: ORF1 [Torque teno virus]
MAYGWWWRRRRRPWRRRRWRRWRRRRRPRRRRPARRYRRRRTVRRRRRGRWTRRYRRWRRKGKRRGKKKIIIRQWQPNYRRRCNIVGYMPLLICGENTVARNYATHSDDSYYPGPFGGGMTTDKFTLRILYDEYKRFMNYWTASNEDLDLCRYLGCTLYVFRHPEVDFIIIINTSPPFLDTEITGPSIHPGMMALNKRARWIPSLKNRPGRKHYVKIKVGAPRMFTDKWYPQTDLCDMTLLTIFASAADMQYPFGSPLTDTIIVSFQVLQSMYNDCLSVLPSNFAQPSGKGYLLYEKIRKHLPYYNTTQTQAQLKRYIDNQTTTTDTWNSYINTKKFNSVEDPTTDSNSIGGPCTTYSDTWYKGTAYVKKITEIPPKAAKLYYDETKKLIGITFTGSTEYLHYTGGLYTSIWLSAGRSYFETKGPYTDITYNPFADRGEGNMVWIDWLTKDSSEYSKTQSKCLIADMPLWASVYGYTEYCSKVTGDTNIEHNCRCVIRSPYTVPQLLDHNNSLRGYVPYSFNFGNGKMPGGSSAVPMRMRAKWYVTLFHQKEVLEALAQSGPYAYHSDIKKVSLGVKYRFKWVWGGNPVSQQVVRNPCKTTQGSSGNRVPRSIQVVDPRYNTPELTIHAWDFRHGFFGRKAIKRMQEQPIPHDTFSAGYKRSRRDTEALQSSQEEHQKENLLFPVQQLKRVPPWETSQESQSEEETSQKQETLSQQLRDQLHKQRVMGEQLRSLLYQMQRVQQNQHINPMLLPKALALTSISHSAT